MPARHRAPEAAEGNSVPVSILLALFSALTSAANLLMQRVSSGAGPSGSVLRLARYLLRQPLWLLGAGAAVASFVLQAAALRRGQLSVVQPVLVTELVFVLLLRQLWLRQSVRALAWTSAGVTCVGLAGFLVAAEPRGGHLRPTDGAWVTCVLAFGGSALALAVFASRGSPARRAALYAAAAAVTGAFGATLIKTAVTTLTSNGPAELLTSWPVYALILTMIASAVLIQAALHVGPLTVSQPVLVILNPIVSIWLSVWLFAEHFTDDAAVLALGACSFATLIVGVIILTRSAPQQDLTGSAAGATPPPVPVLDGRPG